MLDPALGASTNILSWCIFSSTLDSIPGGKLMLRLIHLATALTLIKRPIIWHTKQLICILASLCSYQEWLGSLLPKAGGFFVVWLFFFFLFFLVLFSTPWCRNRSIEKPVQLLRGWGPVVYNHDWFLCTGCFPKHLCSALYPKFVYTTFGSTWRQIALCEALLNRFLKFPKKSEPKFI